jgi:hypothetical protein
MAIIYEVYPKVLVSKEKFIDIYLAICWLVDGHPKEGFTPKFIGTY